MMTATQTEIIRQNTVETRELRLALKEFVAELRSNGRQAWTRRQLEEHYSMSWRSIARRMEAHGLRVPMRAERVSAADVRLLDRIMTGGEG